MTRITIPIFPLPDVVLFPGQVLPLHIFEPRYRQMVTDVLAGDHRLGMALLKPGWEATYAGNPPIHAIVGFGVIKEAIKLADGRFNIRLHGEGKGRVESEILEAPYRKAVLITFEDRPASSELAAWVSRIKALVAELGVDEKGELERVEGDAPVPDGVELVNAVAANLPVPAAVKLELLELDDPAERARRVVTGLEEVLSRHRIFDRFRPSGDWKASHN